MGVDVQPNPAGKSLIDRKVSVNWRYFVNALVENKDVESVFLWLKIN